MPPTTSSVRCSSFAVRDKEADPAKNAVYRTNMIIAALEEKKSGIESDKKKSVVSVLIPIGLLISSCMILIEDLFPPFIDYPIRIFAIIMMAVGIVQTLRQSR